MNKNRAYVKFLEAFKESECPVCRLLLEDSRAYLDNLLYESVLDVPMRMMLMESFGLCSWHARQIPTLPSICAPSVGFAIFASDLLRKFDYLGRAMTSEHHRESTWKSWFKKRRRFLSLIKERPCPACEHVKQFESYHLTELLDAIEDEEFFDAYKASVGICLPHLFILEESHFSHPNFSFFLELQLCKAKALRDTLEEFIRKQDFRLGDQITREESLSWKAAMEILGGKPGVFANEMGHDLFQRSREGTLSYRETGRTRPAGSCGVEELINEAIAAKQITLCLKKPLPADLFKKLQQLAQERPKGTMEAAVEDLDDVEYLRGLHTAGFSLFYGIGLPPQSIILLDRKRGFVLQEDQQNVGWRLRSLKEAEDFYLSLLWHRFGIAVLFSGLVEANDPKQGLFCLTVEGKREQWCRLKEQAANKFPKVGGRVEVFGWEKWNAHIVEALEVTSQ